MISRTREMYSFGKLWDWTQNLVLFQAVNVEWTKAVRRTLNLPYETHRRLLHLVVNEEAFKCQHNSRLHIFLNKFPSSENNFVSFIGAKTGVMGSLGHKWAWLVMMDSLGPFDPQHGHTHAHAETINANKYRIYIYQSVNLSTNTLLWFLTHWPAHI